MTIIINCTLVVAKECSFEVTERQLDVMVSAGVDVCDEWAVSDWYRDHLDQEVDGVYFRGLFRIADEDEHSASLPEIEEWYAEGEAPDQYRPEPDDEAVTS